MLSIKTITEHVAKCFDAAVNEALAEGWELVRRECFITGADRATTFYAELERITDTSEEEGADDVAYWELSRNPHMPYRCSKCKYTVSAPYRECPNCQSAMIPEGEV